MIWVVFPFLGEDSFKVWGAQIPVWFRSALVLVALGQIFIIAKVWQIVYNMLNKTAGRYREPIRPGELRR